MAAERLGVLMVAAMLGQVATAEWPELTVSGAVRVPWAGAADWTMKIDGEGRVTGAAKGASCTVTREERAELRRLLLALPLAETQGRFGKGNPDTHVLFSLAIGQQGVVRRYSYWKCEDEPCRDEAAIESIKRLWRFLRGLCQGTPGSVP